ncbi:MAG: c-type cytochrome [Hyphomicrobium zavarzinii]|jgi:cytochrome c|uniref:c-type cytochrome n=1 Tax=Hyphomicrobium TaxID=81 RepID=UPI00036DDB27|nr:MULTISPECIES: c-type cytochrome [Hyphomicrobium]MBL8847733.1 c-type cytochrome [Hyphomicrobium zavarzinii]WBT39295.1 c-type cytochrome [Hyphomicrobium sp. DMF-1]HML41954.1 c-type cytochrome [Hyphomicrobium zavarzinii]
MHKALLPLVVGLAWYAPVFAAGSAGDDAGQVAFNTHCRNCHSTNPGDNRLGPSLHNIFGAKAGQVHGFANYSGSLTSDMTWDEATLDKFITDPTALASNTTMKPFAGVADAEQRKLIIDFLKTKSKS